VLQEAVGADHPRRAAVTDQPSSVLIPTS
jgi:hypothetical protein